MSVNSKHKGNAWEREVSNILSSRFKDFLGVDHGFMRNQNSGAYFGGHNTVRITTHLEDFQAFGDILCPPTFKWSVEAKSYKNQLTLSSILAQKSKQLDDWIEQAETDAKNAQKEPLLAIKFNNCPPFVFLTEKYPQMCFCYRAYRAYRMDYWLTFPDPHYFSSVVPQAI